MRTIWKFPVPPENRFALTMPRGAEVLTVQTQFGAPYMWAIVSPGRQTETRQFHVVCTGEPIPPTAHSYVGTFQLAKLGGAFVGHLFECERPGLPELERSASSAPADTPTAAELAERQHNAMLERHGML